MVSPIRKNQRKPMVWLVVVCFSGCGKIFPLKPMILLIIHTCWTDLPVPKIWLSVIHENWDQVKRANVTSFNLTRTSPVGTSIAYNDFHIKILFVPCVWRWFFNSRRELFCYETNSLQPLVRLYNEGEFLLYHLVKVLGSNHSHHSIDKLKLENFTIDQSTTYEFTY
jgi:hypothetical protein